MANRAIRLTIVGSSPILCTGLASLLDDHGDVQLVEVGNTADHYRDLDIDVTVVVLVGLSLDAATRTLCEVALVQRPSSLLSSMASRTR